MKYKIIKFFSFTLIFLFAVAFVIKFGGPNILRRYLETGIGDCQKIPILCMVPVKEIKDPKIDNEYIAGLLPYKFPRLSIYVPKGFIAYQERFKKEYYKKTRHQHKGPIMYLLHEEEGFFINLFPQLKGQGIDNDYEFISRLMYARMDSIKNLTDAFFVIMKSIFIPDLGQQRNVVMAKLQIGNKRGFINYNLTGQENYFDCFLFNNKHKFFKIYIKDRGRTLNLDKVLSIISTIKEED